MSNEELRDKARNEKRKFKKDLLDINNTYTYKY